MQVDRNASKKVTVPGGGRTTTVAERERGKAQAKQLRRSNQKHDLPEPRRSTCKSPTSLSVRAASRTRSGNAKLTLLSPYGPDPQTSQPICVQRLCCATAARCPSNLRHKHKMHRGTMPKGRHELQTDRKQAMTEPIRQDLSIMAWAWLAAHKSPRSATDRAHHAQGAQASPDPSSTTAISTLRQAGLCERCRKEIRNCRARWPRTPTRESGIPLIRPCPNKGAKLRAEARRHAT